MNFKKLMAHMIVKQLNNADSADQAQKHFESTFQQKQTPQDLESKKVESRNIIDVLVETGMAKSKSEAKRLIEQGGVRIDQKVVSSSSYLLTPDDSIINVGARKFVKVLVN